MALGGDGASTVIGHRERLPLRDAALVNGVLLHGLDFDDSHLTAIIHPTVTCLPAAFGVGEAQRASGADMLAAYIAGMECAIRIGASVKGGFHHVGFHATGVISHFSSRAGRRAAARSRRRCARRARKASPPRRPAACRCSSRRARGPSACIRAGARLPASPRRRWQRTASSAPRAPTRAASACSRRTCRAMPPRWISGASRTASARVWELPDTSIKPYPICHFIHGAAEAAIRLHGKLKPTPESLAEIRVRIPKDTLPIVAEPVAIKTAPANDYDAKFSAQYVVATCLLKGRIGLAELEPEARNDPVVRALGAPRRGRGGPRIGLSRNTCPAAWRSPPRTAGGMTTMCRSTTARASGRSMQAASPRSSSPPPS